MKSDPKRDSLEQPVKEPDYDRTKGGGDVISKGGDQQPGETNDDSARTPIKTDQI